MDDIRQLEEENEQLKAENKKLKNILKQYGIFVPEDGKKLNAEEKISIFMDYFHGRRDLYNKYYWNEKKKRFYWSVDCANFWKNGCLIKAGAKVKNRCFHCPVSSFRTLTEETLRHLFKGDAEKEFSGIGIYPLLRDNTCYLLAMDFDDDDDWFDQMLCVYRTAVAEDFYPVMERSQSGQGGHLWFFFAVNVKAYDARRFGQSLLEKSMMTNKTLSFDSFDRMFPNQDYVPDHGAGNCIALPLRADTYRKGNSAFINTLGQVIRQPIEYLKSRPKITAEQLQAYLEENRSSDYFFDDDQMQMNLQTGTKYVPELHGLICGRIMIEKRGLNAATINVIHRCASMWNPEYYQKQKRHEMIYAPSTPCVLHFYEEDNKYIYLPGGLLEKLQDCLPETKLLLEEQYSHGTDIPVSFTGELRENQKNAVEKLIRNRNGVLQAVPGFGKTVCGIWLIAHFHVSTLIIVDTSELQNQWEDRLNQFAAFPHPEKKRDRFIRQLNGNKKILGGKIDIAIADSLVNLKNLSEVMHGYGLVLVDECHHASSPTYRTILSTCTSEHLYGLTATPERGDGLGKVGNMYLGPIRYRETQAAAMKDYQFKQVLVPRYTDVKMLDSSYTYQDMIVQLAQDQGRNWLIYRDVVQEYRNDGKIIILSERVEHLEKLAELLEKSCEDVYLLTGSVKKQERKKIIDKVRMIPRNRRYILLATSKLLGEGFDLPSLKTMFLVLPITASGRIEQYTGRIHRNYEGKDIVKVYDYVDIEIPMAAAMYHKRLVQYQKEGYFVEETEKEIEVSQYYFESENGRSILKKEIQSASKEIICFTSTPSVSFIQDHYDFLAQPIRRGIKVYAVVPSDLKESEAGKYLEGM